jgi:hypothetical protein
MTKAICFGTDMGCRAARAKALWWVSREEGALGTLEDVMERFWMASSAFKTIKKCDFEGRKKEKLIRIHRSFLSFFKSSSWQLANPPCISSWQNHLYRYTKKLESSVHHNSTALVVLVDVLQYQSWNSSFLNRFLCQRRQNDEPLATKLARKRLVHTLQLEFDFKLACLHDVLCCKTQTKLCPYDRKIHDL